MFSQPHQWWLNPYPLNKAEGSFPDPDIEWLEAMPPLTLSHANTLSIHTPPIHPHVRTHTHAPRTPHIHSHARTPCTHMRTHTIVRKHTSPSCTHPPPPQLVAHTLLYQWWLNPYPLNKAEGNYPDPGNEWLEVMPPDT